MKNINAHTHWQFGNFSPGKEHRLIYDTDKPTGAPEVEEEVKEALEKTQNLEQVQQQAGEKIKQAEDDMLPFGFIDSGHEESYEIDDTGQAWFAAE